MSRSLYRGNSSFFRFTQWRRKRFTPVGGAVGTLVFICAVLGLRLYRNQIYEVLAFFLALLVLSMIRARFFRPLLDAKRLLPKYATVGEKLIYRVAISNFTAKMLEGLVFLDNTGDPRPTYDEFMAEKEPNEDDRNAWDRKVMYHRWAWMVRRNRQAYPDYFPVPELPPNPGGVNSSVNPGVAATFQVELEPLRRGYLELTGITIGSPGPFGLFRGVKELDVHDRVLILPKRYPLPQLRLPGSRKYHSGGVAMTTSIGNSSEFISLRDYRPGDPLRHIHWKSWAKTDRLIIKEFQDEYFVRHALILDTDINNGDRESFEEAVSVAASFVLTVQNQESLLDLMFVEEHAYCFSSGRGLGYSENMLEILACVKGSVEKNESIFNLSTLVKKYTPLLSGCICIFLAWDSERKDFVSWLMSRSIPVKVLLISKNEPPAPDESDPKKNDSGNFHFLKPGNMEEGLAQL
ncbi:MAG: DUF58 domain-containing protein [bacterium]|nr:DUF58 domain-containing protein [bacterium]